MMRKIALVFVGLLFVAAPAMARAPHHRAATQNHAQPPAANQPPLIYVPFVLADPGDAPPMDSDGDEQVAPPDDDSVDTPTKIHLNSQDGTYNHAIWPINPPDIDPDIGYTRH